MSFSVGKATQHVEISKYASGTKLKTLFVVAESKHDPAGRTSIVKAHVADFKHDQPAAGCRACNLIQVLVQYQAMPHAHD